MVNGVNTTWYPQLQMQCQPLLVLASIVTLAFGTDVGDLLDDLGNVKISVTNLRGGIGGFPVPGGTLTQALVCSLSPALLMWF